MTTLPDDLRDQLSEMLGGTVVGTSRVGGGMINETAIVEMSSGRFFVKWRTDAPDGFYAAEAAGLDLLRRHGAIRVPEVAGYRDAAESLVPCLVLEYIETRPCTNASEFTRRFAEALAETHKTAIAVDRLYGLDHDNFIGLLPQRNRTAGDGSHSWSAFYRDLRLVPQIEIARSAGLIQTARERLIGHALQRIDVVLDGYPQAPSLLHGDLWSGNYLAVGNDVAIVDPAVYYGDREVEIAFIELFGGFPPGFVEAYSAAYPLDPGYRHRRTALQLYPLLVHLNTFGETYGPSLDAALLDVIHQLV